MVARKAYSEAAKDQRREEILHAAETLFVESGRLPTVASIAVSAGIAKGTIYLYFQSSEEIFAAIVLGWWESALGALESELSAAASASEAADLFPAALAAQITARPVLMRLDAILPELKTRMSEAARTRFHTALAARLMRAGEALETILEFSPGRGRQVLVRSHAFARGLWQSFDGRGEDCEKEVGLSGFSQELREALGEYWQGARPEIYRRVI